MAWSSAILSAQETADFALDYPILVGTNPGDGLVDARWNTTGSLASADISAVNFPASLGMDRKGNHLTKPNAAALTNYWCADLGAAPPDFDVAVLLKHNMGTIGSGTAVLQIADDAAFTVNLQTLGTFDPNPNSENTRQVLTSLFHTGAVPLRYTLARYVRLNFTFGTVQTPQFGELWLGRRRQLSDNPLLAGYDNEAEESGRLEFTADDGNTTLYGVGARRRVFAASFVLGKGHAAESETVRSWWSDCKGGTRPVMVMLQPNTAPETTSMICAPSSMLSRPILSIPSAGWTKRRWDVEFRETDTFLADD